MTSPADRLPPHSIEAEQGTLGCLLIAPRECWPECQGILTPEHFYDLRHREIYTTIGSLMAASEVMDIITLQQRLKDRGMLEAVGGLVYVSSLPDAVPSAANLEYYTAILREKHSLRRMLGLCAEFSRRLYEHTGEIDTLLAGIERDVIAVNTERQPSETLTGPKCSRVLIDDLDARAARKGAPTGIITGFFDLDRCTDGLQFGDQFILGARPSAGKTAFGLCVANRAALHDGVPTLFITLESGPAALLRRLAAINGAAGMYSLKRGNFTEQEMKSLSVFTARVTRSPLFILDLVSGANEVQVSSAIRRHARQHGVKLAIVDYLQKILPSARHVQRTYEIAGISGALKAAAATSGVALLTLAQLNRESEKNKNAMPRLCDLADSAQIERDADVVALLHRDKSDPSKPAFLVIAKQRDGELDNIPLTFDGAHCRFQDHAHDPGL